MVYQMFLKLMHEFTKNPMGQAEQFSNRYMDMFYNYNEKLNQEVDNEIFDIFDDINWLCDSYEDDNAIRDSDQNCIDESTLRENLKIYIDRLKQLGLSQITF